MFNNDAACLCISCIIIAGEFSDFAGELALFCDVDDIDDADDVDECNFTEVIELDDDIGECEGRFRGESASVCKIE